MKYYLSILMVGFICGCSTSPLSRHSPDLIANAKLSNASTVLLADAVIVDGLSGDTDGVNVIENQKLAKRTLQLFAGRLNEKGFAVDRFLNSSAGYLMNPEIPYWVVEKPEGGGNGDAFLGRPPFYTNEFFTADTLRHKLLTAVYGSLMDFKRTEEAPVRNIPASSYLSRSLGGGMIGIIFLGGYSAGASNEYGRYVLPKSQTEEKVSVRKISQYSMMFFLIDGKTGDILWDDEVVMKGGLMHDQKLETMVAEICDKLF